LGTAVWVDESPSAGTPYFRLREAVSGSLEIVHNRKEPID